MIRIGVDIGGTFTDLCAMDGEGRCWSTKLLTTPADPSTGFLEILNRAFEAEPRFREVAEIIHATTVATNAILEHNTARLGLITTAGFRDVLEIGRHFRRDLYNLFLQKPPVLVPRRRRLEVEERVSASGEVIHPLNRKQVQTAIEKLVDEQVETIVVGFLHSYIRPDHELQVVEMVRECCDIPVIPSHTVCSEYREYERFSTAAVHGAVLPNVRRYLQRVQHSLGRNNVKAPLSVMQSNGGMAQAATVMEQPGSIIESGPAAGAIAAIEVGRRLGLHHLLSFDMGGTTAKATLIRDGQLTISNDYEVGGGIQGGFGTGYALRTPVVDLVEVGTGGGSIAFVDEVGQLHVGPRSAGADPGPACYGRGGNEPTVTDANVVLGRINPRHFAGGQFCLDAAAACQAIERSVADPLGLTVTEAAEGIIALANAHMVRALQLVSVERGYDPRDFAMIAFGGAGPMHAVELARELGCPQVIIPREAGVQSAWGLLVADARRDFSQSIASQSGKQEVNLEALHACYESMVRRGQDELSRAGFDKDKIRDRLAIDVRYIGQSYEVTVQHSESASFDAAMVAEINRLFHEQHARLYGHSDENAVVEWVTLRAAVQGEVPRPVVQPLATPMTPLTERQIETQPMTWDDQCYASPVYHRSDLGAGDCLSGPALVIQSDSSLAIAPEAALTVEPDGDIRLQLGGRA